MDVLISYSGYYNWKQEANHISAKLLCFIFLKSQSVSVVEHAELGNAGSLSETSLLS